MTDNDSKNTDRHEVDLPLFEENIHRKSANERVDLDQLQDDFNSLMADSEATYTGDSSAESSMSQIPEPQFTNHLGAPPQDSAAHTAEYKATEEQDQTSYEEATNTFNDLADAFTTDSTASHDDDFSVFDLDEQTPASSQPISGDSIPTHDSNSLFENEDPAYADLSGHDETDNAPKKHIIALVALILITTSAGIYWYTTGSTEQTVQHVKTEQFKSPEMMTQNSSSQTSQNRSDTSNSEHSKEVTTPEKASNNPTQTESTIPTSLSTADAIKLVTVNRSTTFTKWTPTDKRPTQASSLGGWVIIAPVTSKISASLYVESFNEKGTQSEVMESNKAGSTKYAVRILGFKSKQAAEKQLKKLPLLGLRNAKALKATTAWITDKSPSTATGKSSKGHLDSVNRAKTAPAKTNKTTPSTGSIAKTVKTRAVPATTPQTVKISKPQHSQQVIEFDLDDLL